MIMVDKFVQDLATLDLSGHTFVFGFMTGMQYVNAQQRDKDDLEKTSKNANGSNSSKVEMETNADANANTEKAAIRESDSKA